MTMKKKLLTTLSVVLILGLAALGILAYLTDTDSDVNVMTLGNVDIEQEEVFEQGADLYPGVTVQKEVSVKNVGESDAYVRTLVAFETIDAEGFSYVPTWADGVTAAKLTTIEKDGVQYDVYEVVYNDAVAPNTETSKSLMSVKLSEDCTNEHMEALGGTYEVLVLSQAVQAEGFDDAQTALDAAFPKGDNNANVADWFGSAATAKVVSSNEELTDAITNANDGDVIKLAAGTYSGISFTNPANYTAKDLTILGEDGVILEGFSINGWSADNNIEIDGLTFKNVTFSKGLLLSTKDMKDVTVVDCEFINDASINQNDRSEKITNLVIKNCTFTGDKNGTTTAIMLENAENVTVKGCTFNNIDYNVVQAGTLGGTILIDDNKINGTGDRVFRFAGSVGNMTISNNTIVSNGDADGELAKSTNACEINLSGNTWNGNLDSEVADKLINITAK